MAQPGKRTTIYDIAALAGTSGSAVSAILNDRWQARRISAELAERVRRIAAEQGYARNRQASALRRQRSGIVGMIVPKYDNRYFGAIAEQFEQRARAAGLFPVVTCTQRDPALEIAASRELIGQQVDTLIATGATDPDRITAMCRRAGVTSLNLDLPGTLAPSVISDNYAGALRLGLALLDRCEATGPGGRNGWRPGGGAAGGADDAAEGADAAEGDSPAAGDAPAPLPLAAGWPRAGAAGCRAGAAATDAETPSQNPAANPAANPGPGREPCGGQPRHREPDQARPPPGRIGFVGGRAEDHNTRERLRGFQAALARRGLAVAPQDVLMPGYGAARVRAALDADRGPPFAGLFVNSTIALEGVLDWRGRGGDGPALACFDWDPFAAHLASGIPMMRQDVTGLLDGLFAALADPPAAPPLIEVPPILELP